MRSPYRSARRKGKPLAEERIRAYTANAPLTEARGRKLLNTTFMQIVNLTIRKEAQNEPKRRGRRAG